MSVKAAAYRHSQRGFFYRFIQTGQLQKKLQCLLNIWFAGELERNDIKEDEHAQISHRLHQRLILTLTYCYGQILSFLTFYSSNNTLQ